MFTSENVLCMKLQLQLTAPTHLLLCTITQNFNKCKTIFCCHYLIFFFFVNSVLLVSCSCGSLESPPFSETVSLEQVTLMYYDIDFKTVQ